MKKIIVPFLLAAVSLAKAQETSQEMANKLANPVASMISVPLQSNVDFGVGSLNGSRFISNIQPVIPFKVGDNWNLITRVILPFVELRNVTGINKTDFGMSDINLSAFLSPNNSKKLIWGVGPALIIPSATKSVFGSEKFSAGPTVLVLKQAGGITYGMLARQVWSVAGKDTRTDVSELYMQPFFTYNFKSGAGLATNLELTQNWQGDRFSGYMNFMGSMLSTFGKQPVSFAIGPRIPINSNTLGDWGLRASATFIFK